MRIFNFSLAKVTILTILKQHGSNFYVCDKAGNTLAHLAAYKKQHQVLEYLIR